MKTIFTTILVCVFVFILTTADGQKKRKNMFNLNLKDGSLISNSRGSIGIPKIPTLPKKPKITSISKKEKNRREILKKMRQVKSTEDFLKIFKIPYKKVKKTKKTNPKVPKPGLGDGFLKSLTLNKEMLTKTIVEEPEYSLVPLSMTAPGSSDIMKSATSTSTNEVSVKEDLACKPRLTVYSLPVSNDYVSYPSCFGLNQCGGCCSTLPGYICKPTELEITAELYYKIHHNSFEVTQDTVTLSHHKACACQCKLDKSDCLPTQTLDLQTCSCNCLKEPQSCDVNKTWSSIHCACVCNAASTACPDRKEWDEDKCKCRCKPKTCQKGQIQDPTTCYCVHTSSY